MKKFIEGKIKIRIFRSLKKIGVSLVLFSFLASLWTIPGTNAGFSDEEKSQENNLAAGSLDALVNPLSFAYTAGEAPMEPGDIISKKINYENAGTLPFQYRVKYSSADNNALCEALILTAKKGSDIIYDGLPLADFDTGDFIPPTPPITADSLTLDLNDNTDWEFIWELPTDPSKNLEEQTCNFNFEFIAWQLDLTDETTGFHDEELADPDANMEIESGEWINPGDVLINKVYYDVDEKHRDVDSNSSSEWKYEWIELYNPLDQPVNLKDWQICDNNDCKTIHANVEIPALGYALLAHDNSVWEHYWEIPEEVETINLGGSPGHLALSNSEDMLVLLSSENTVVDQMNWGTPVHTWANYAAYSAGIWEPGVADAGDGHMLGRVPTGFDNDLASDWQDLEVPEVELLYPIGGETWYAGQTYNLLWDAESTNASSSDADLKIDLYYSNDSGQSWAPIVLDEENDGIYNWKVPLFLGYYYVPSHFSRIKVVATGPENFMVQAMSSSTDFCPPIDYDALSPEEQELVDQLVAEGLIDESEVIRGGVSAEDILDGMESAPELEINSTDILLDEETSMEILEMREEAEEEKLAELQAELQAMEAGDILSSEETTPEPEEEVETLNSDEAVVPVEEVENNSVNIIPNEE